MPITRKISKQTESTHITRVPIKKRNDGYTTHFLALLFRNKMKKERKILTTISLEVYIHTHTSCGLKLFALNLCWLHQMRLLDLKTQRLHCLAAYVYLMRKRWLNSIKGRIRKKSNTLTPIAQILL